MRILIVDDEPLARARLRALVEDLHPRCDIAEAAGGVAAISVAKTSAVDTVLLDIRMPGMDGLETARHLARLQPPPAVIFTTAYDEHALAAFEANAIDYLLKPIRATRLRQALDKAAALSGAQVSATAAAADETHRSHLSGMQHGSLVLIELDDILYFHADQGYVEVVWTQGSMLLEDSLRALEQEFEGRFLRVHRNTLVAPQHVSGLRREADGNHVVTIRGREVRLPVSRRLLQAAKQRLK